MLWLRTCFALAVEGGECGQRTDEDAEIDEWQREGEPVDHCDAMARERVCVQLWWGCYVACCVEWWVEGEDLFRVCVRSREWQTWL